jgi:Domain of unknown function (DUF4625)
MCGSIILLLKSKLYYDETMRKLKLLTLILIPVIPLSFGSCERNAIDKEKPVIDLNQPDAYPVNCDTIYFGETFVFHVTFTDNRELGSYSIDIHHNFDHHSHSTEVTECSLNPVKDPVNPLIFIEDYNIPENLTEYETNLSISIPSGNNSGLFDEGDYHFFISLTDGEGWSLQKGLSIKMLHR